jgi:hypothetical protein
LACNSKLKELISQQARIESAPVKFGISGIVHQGIPVYPYGKACKEFGNVKYPKASERRARQPKHFFKVFGRNFITEKYLQLLKGYYDYKNASNQLKLAL